MFIIIIAITMCFSGVCRAILNLFNIFVIMLGHQLLMYSMPEKKRKTRDFLFTTENKRYRRIRIIVRERVWVYVWSIPRLTVRVVWSAGARILTASYRSAVRLINLALWLLLHLSPLALSVLSAFLLAISLDGRWSIRRLKQER